MKKNIALAFLGALLSASAEVTFDFRLENGSPRYDVRLDGHALATVGTGLELAEPLTAPLAVERREKTRRDETWRPVWGDRAVVRDRFVGETVTLREASPRGRCLVLEARAYPEGFAVRQRLVVAEGEAWEIKAEKTTVRFPVGSRAWAIRKTEDTFPERPLAVASMQGDYMMPLTVQVPDAGCASFFEAYVRHYPRAKAAVAGGVVGVRLMGDGTCRGRGVFETPWRVLQVGRNAARLLENATLVLNLNPPCALTDTSWIRPGNCLSDEGTCSTTTKDILAAVDANREAGFRYFQIDWGWYGTEWTWTDEERAGYRRDRPNVDREVPGWEANTRADPYKVAKGYVPYNPWWKKWPGGKMIDLDVPQLVTELARRQMGLCLYLNGRMLEVAELDRLFAHYAKWGVVGLKPGFVKYGDSAATEWNRRLVEAAARHRLWLDVHDLQIPDGMQRTYPNLLLVEGGGGEEGHHPVRQDVILPFTRELVGPFDFTPRFFRKGNTRAHQAAFALAHNTPSIVVRGSPKLAAEWGSERRFLKDLPMTWDESRVLAAEIGSHLAVARRSGETWYLGGQCGAEAVEITLDFGFLPSDRPYELELLGDDGETTKTVLRTDRHPVRMQKAGGFVAVVRPIVEPKGCPDFKIERPQTSGEVVPAARFGVTPEADDIGPALQKAFDWCVKRPGVTLHLEKDALYTIRTPVRMAGFRHFTFDGRGAKIRQDRVIREKMGNLWTVFDCRYVVIRDFSADWNWKARPLASFGTIERVEGDSFDFRFVDYEKFPWRDVRVAEISEADPVTRSPGVDGKAQLHFEFYLGKFAPKTEWIEDNLLRVTGGGTDWNRSHLHFLKKGHAYRMYHNYYEGGAFFFGANSHHVTFEDINLYSSIGKNFHFAGMYRWQLVRVRCMPPPNRPRRVVSSTADGYGHERCWGGFKMIDCVFAAGNDDFLNFQDTSVFCVKTASNVVEAVNYRGSVPSKGESVRLFGPQFEDLKTVARVTSAERLPHGHVSPGPWGKISADGWRFALDRPIPAVTNGSPVLLCETKWNSGDVLIRGCLFEGTEGSGRFQASNVTVEDCVFRDVIFSPMRICAEYTRNAWCEGHGVTNMVVRNCRFERCSHGRRMDVTKPWPNITIQAHTPFGLGKEAFRDILIENCRFRDPAGLALRAIGVRNLILRNNIVEDADGKRIAAEDAIEVKR